MWYLSFDLCALDPSKIDANEESIPRRVYLGGQRSCGMKIGRRDADLNIRSKWVSRSHAILHVIENSNPSTTHPSFVTLTDSSSYGTTFSLPNDASCAKCKIFPKNTATVVQEGTILYFGNNNNIRNGFTLKWMDFKLLIHPAFSTQLQKRMEVHVKATGISVIVLSLSENERSVQNYHSHCALVMESVDESSFKIDTHRELTHELMIWLNCLVKSIPVLQIGWIAELARMVDSCAKVGGLEESAALPPFVRYRPRIGAEFLRMMEFDQQDDDFERIWERRRSRVVFDGVDVQLNECAGKTVQEKSRIRDDFVSILELCGARVEIVSKKSGGHSVAWICESESVSEESSWIEVSEWKLVQWIVSASNVREIYAKIRSELSSDANKGVIGVHDGSDQVLTGESEPEEPRKRMKTGDTDVNRKNTKELFEKGTRPGFRKMQKRASIPFQDDIEVEIDHSFGDRLKQIKQAKKTPSVLPNASRNSAEIWNPSLKRHRQKYRIKLKAIDEDDEDSLTSHRFQYCNKHKFNARQHSRSAHHQNNSKEPSTE